jgi:hypothetical protein
VDHVVTRLRCFEQTNTTAATTIEYECCRCGYKWRTKRGREIMTNPLKDHKIVSDEKWIEARKSLLKKEKEFTALRDQLNEQRRELLWKAVNKEYLFDGSKGKETRRTF